MSEIVIEHISSLRAIDFEAASYLWVIHADKIPPHIGISHGGRFFSLKANGKDENLKIDRIESVLYRKEIPVLFYKINSEAIAFTPEAIFSKYDKTVTGKITCLEPLKEICGVENATWIKELLNELDSTGMIQKCFGWQLSNDFKGIPDYKAKDIHARLAQLENV